MVELGKSMLTSGEKSKILRELLGLSQSEFAEKLNLTKTYFKDVERLGCKRAFSPRIATILAKNIVQSSDGTVRIVTREKPKQNNEISLSSDWLIYGEEPMFNTAKQIYTIETEDRIFYLQQNQNIKYFTMADDMMLPEIHKGHIFAVDTSQKEIQNGQLYYLIAGNKKVLRQIEELEYNKLYVKTYNMPDKFSYVIDKKEVEVIGKFYFSGYFPR